MISIAGFSGDGCEKCSASDVGKSGEKVPVFLYSRGHHLVTNTLTGSEKA